MDILSLVVGFAIGIIVLGLAIEIGIKKSSQTTAASKHTKKWSISEIANPRIMAEYLSDVKLPQNSKILVNQYKNKEMLAGLDAKEHKGIRGNYIVGDDRALILAGPVKKDEVAFWTVEKEIVEQLKQDFDEMWSEGTSIQKGKET
ncbi:MAG: hypothetical protein KAH91_03180 [Thermoplasmatales archaeon]|nr:hypothetical protein [Thermoplasmatales archaeon]MCK5636399.1 hypothetical protein [Thermoplasmatales archaeon]